jgi:hypothetical protein
MYVRKQHQFGIVVHSYSPSYLRSRDKEDHSLGPVQAKIQKTPISTNKLGVVVDVCDPSYKGGKTNSVMVQASPDMKAGPYSKNNKKQKG